MQCAVECYAGFRGDETPRRFFVNDREVEVVAVEGRWREPRRRIFRVGGTTGSSTACGRRSTPAGGS